MCHQTMKKGLEYVTVSLVNYSYWHELNDSIVPVPCHAFLLALDEVFIHVGIFLHLQFRGWHDAASRGVHLLME